MNYQAYFPSVKLVESLRSTSKKEHLKKTEIQRGSKSTSKVAATTKIIQKELIRDNSKPKETANNNIYIKLRKEITDNTHGNNEKNSVIVHLSGNNKVSSPLNKSGNININQKLNINNSTNFSEFNKNVMKQKSNPMNASSNIIMQNNKIKNKSHAENSFNATSVNIIKSSNVSFDKHSKEDKDKNLVNNLIKEDNSLSNSSQTKSMNNLFKTNIEVDSPEELHYFYVSILRQNKNLAYKFEGENLPDNNEIKDNYDF